MAKGKSSASSATRKKHAKKAAGASGQIEEPNIPKEKKAKGKDKKSKEPRKKVYIPPVKPTPVQPDPLDTLGIAQKLPPELLVILRRLAKKDSITKRRALEDFHALWVDKARNEGADSPLLVVLADTIPVWLHHVPALFLHPSRRIRLLAVGLHSSLLHMPSIVTDPLFFFLREMASPDQAEYIMGAWCMAAHDVDRQVSALARESWNRCVSLSSDSGKPLTLNQNTLAPLWEFVQHALLDPNGVYLHVNPPQLVASPPPVQRKGGKTGPVPLRKDEEGSVRAKTEEEEENEQDRRARLRIGAFGSAEWVINALATDRSTDLVEGFIAPFANAALWSALYHGQMPPFVNMDEAFGYNQPGVRKASWSLLQTLLRTCKAHLDSLLPVMSSAILRSAWVEPDSNVRGVMWQPLLTFLREYPKSWEIDASKEPDEGEDEDEENNESEEEDEEVPKHSAQTRPVNGPRTSQAYREFLQFLELGCSGSPLQGYPAVLIILSTIPSSVLASSSTLPLTDFFAAFWAALDGRALSSLDRGATSAAFLSSLLECLVFLVRRILNSPSETAASMLFGTSVEEVKPTSETSGAAVEGLVREQIGRVWTELSSRHLKSDERAAALLISRNLASLNQLDADLFQVAWDELASGVKTQVGSEDSTSSILVSIVLKVLQDTFTNGSGPEAAAKALTGEVVQDAIKHCEKILESEETPTPERITSLLTILESFGDLLFSDPKLSKGIDETIRRHIDRLLSISPSLLFIYLAHRQDEQLCLQVWQDILRSIALHPGDVATVLSPMLDAAEKSVLPEYLKPATEGVDDLAGALLVEALASPSVTPEVALIRRLLHAPDHFISSDCFKGLVESLCSAFILHFPDALRDEVVSLDVFSNLLDLLRELFNSHLSVMLSEEISKSLLPDIFLFAYLLPQFRAVDAHQMDLTRGFWDAWLAKAPASTKSNAITIIKERLRELMLDCSVLPSSTQIVHMLSGPCPGLEVDLLTDVVPSRKELDDLLESLPSTPADTSLAVIDPLIPPPSLDHSEAMDSGRYDHLGFSSYARAVYAVMLHLLDDRHIAKSNVWALRHILALALYADELLQLPASQNVVFDSSIAKASLVDVTTKAQQIVAYLLSSVQEEGWHAATVNAILTDKSSDLMDGVGRLVSDLIQLGKRWDTVRESRILHRILQHILSSVSKVEAEQWMSLGRRLEKSAPQTSLAIVYSITQHAPEPPILARYRNELAAGMLGVPTSKANTEGLWLLRRLVACAPDPDSDIVFMQQQRAVNLMKVCQQWITSDEDLDEAVESEMTLVFFHLAPILQNVPGAHWDLVFDVMENNLENCTLTEPSTYVTLSRTLRLFIAIQDLVSTNKALRAVWQERESACLALVRELATTKLDLAKTSTPLSICRELVLQIAQDLPESLMDETTLPKMCHNIADSSIDVQKMAYHFLHEAARKYTEHMVIEAAVDSEIMMKPELPLELIDILQRTFNYDDGIEESQDPSGYLLAWMLAFDLFTDASLKVKSGYIDQLRDLDLVGGHFLPNIFSILGLYAGLPKAFKLDIWAIDEYYLDYAYTTDSPIGLRLLAAHLYYRALLVVPSLIRSWLSECRDRQLLQAVTTYTAHHFSPAIIKTELSQLKDPDATSDLIDENFTVKVANAINEVTASYAVDEHHLELTVKLSSDYPLHGIEVRESAKRVGVPDERWRAWVLGVQQILTFRSGRILDGLSFFKKNVTSHFEGLAECAICYSIISAMDGSLPRKPCKTCKNRFHSSCLYKWFNTSHSSSCPLCRSEII